MSLNNFASYNGILTQLQTIDPALNALASINQAPGLPGGPGTPGYIQDLLSKISGHLNT